MNMHGHAPGETALGDHRLRWSSARRTPARVQKHSNAPQTAADFLSICSSVHVVVPFVAILTRGSSRPPCRCKFRPYADLRRNVTSREMMKNVRFAPRNRKPESVPANATEDACYVTECRVT